MIEKLIEFSAREKYIVLLFTAAVVAFGIWTMYNQPVDAIPDLSDTQVIIYSKWDRSPDIIEDQVTYPITTALLGAPKVKAIRGFSDFGFSYVYIVFEDGTDIYWARSRVLEYLSGLSGRLPTGVTPSLGERCEDLVACLAQQVHYLQYIRAVHHACLHAASFSTRTVTRWPLLLAPWICSWTWRTKKGTNTVPFLTSGVTRAVLVAVP